MLSKKPSYPREVVKGMLNTVNKMGVTTLELAPPTQEFVEFSSHCKKPVLDIGCGFGVSSLAALNMGASVIAFDLAQEHLRVLKDNTSPERRHHLITKVGRFPDDLDFEANSLSAVHASMILHFLTGEEIIAGLKQCYNYLEPGGQLFLGVMTPYLGIYDTKKLCAEYDSRITQSKKWPGYISHIPFVKEEWRNQLPPFAHFFKVDTAVKFVTEAGFEVEVAYYYTLNNIPREYITNGKEYVGFRALKR